MLLIKFISASFEFLNYATSITVTELQSEKLNYLNSLNDIFSASPENVLKATYDQFYKLHFEKIQIEDLLRRLNTYDAIIVQIISATINIVEPFFFRELSSSNCITVRVMNSLLDEFYDYKILLITGIVNDFFLELFQRMENFVLFEHKGDEQTVKSLFLIFIKHFIIFLNDNFELKKHLYTFPRDSNHVDYTNIISGIKSGNRNKYIVSIEYNIYKNINPEDIARKNEVIIMMNLNIFTNVCFSFCCEFLNNITLYVPEDSIENCKLLKDENKARIWSLIKARTLKSYDSENYINDVIDILNKHNFTQVTILLDCVKDNEIEDIVKTYLEDFRYPESLGIEHVCNLFIDIYRDIRNDIIEHIISNEIIYKRIIEMNKQSKIYIYKI